MIRPSPLLGIHHVTAMAGDAQRNIDFYSAVLGQRLVKTTVNFDDPTTYHFYYADAVGTPGTVMTFFPWPNARRGRPGVGEAASVAYAIAAGTFDRWHERLQQAAASALEIGTRFGQRTLTVQDPDGMVLELVADDAPAAHIAHWTDGPVDRAMSLRGFAGITVRVEDGDRLGRFLTDVLGYVAHSTSDGRDRYILPGAQGASYLDVETYANATRPTLGIGSIHHIALRVTDPARQAEWLAFLRDHGLHVTDVKDRRYFQSIYFRAPGGVLFELATDTPGFTVDEDDAHLGTSLCLPPWLEPDRGRIAAALPTIQRYGSST